MGKTKYALFEFDATRAAAGALCVMVKQGFEGNAIVGDNNQVTPETENQGTGTETPVEPNPIPEPAVEGGEGGGTGGGSSQSQFLIDTDIINDISNLPGGSGTVTTDRNGRTAYVDWEGRVTEGQTESDDSENFKGAGICKLKGTNQFVFVIHATEFTFDSKGLPISFNAKNYKLMLAKVINELTAEGSTIGATTSQVTRKVDENGNIYYEAGEEAEQKVLIDSLKARDQFAIEALKSIIDRMPGDPASISDSEMNLYSNAAYKWASNMMLAAAEARTVVTEDETEKTETSDEEVGVLETNTEKILNNIVSSLRRTDYKVGTSQDTGTWHNSNAEWEFEDIKGPKEDEWVAQNLMKIEVGSEVYCNDVADAEANGWGWTAISTDIFAERFAFPELTEFLGEYVKHTPSGEEPSTKTTVGLDDLIKAIKDISSGGGGSASVDFTPLITALQGLSTDRGITALPDVNIGDTGLGRDQAHPIYINGGGFPSRQLLAAAFVAQDADATKVLTDFLTFNVNGAVGYSTKAEMAKAVLASLTADAIYNKIQSNIDTRIQAWLQAARVNVNGTDYPITINTPTS